MKYLYSRLQFVLVLILLFQQVLFGSVYKDTTIIIDLSKGVKGSGMQKNILDPKAEAMFKEVKTKLSTNEKKQIAEQLDLIKYNSKKKELELNLNDNEEKKEEDDFSPSFDLTIYPIDLNKDGAEEVFITISSSFLTGTRGVPPFYLFCNINGQYKKVHEGEAYLIRINQLNKTSFPELCLADEEKWLRSKAPIPGSLFVWKNNKYEEKSSKGVHPTLFKWINIENASKAYQTTIK